MAEVTHTPHARNHAPMLGGGTIILGILALLAPGFAGLAVGWLLGGLLIAGGILRLGWAFRAGGVGKAVLQFVLAGIMGLGGLALLFNPLFTAAVMAIILGIYFIVDGVLEISLGIHLHSIAEGWGWLLFAGIVSVLLGLIIWAQFPLSGIWALGILVGIKLIFTGVSMIAAGPTTHPRMTPTA